MYKHSIYNYEYDNGKGYTLTNFINNKTISISKETFAKYLDFENYLNDKEIKRMIKLGFIIKEKEN